MFSGFYEYFEGVYIAWAIGGARPAEQAAIESFKNTVWVLEQILRQPIQQGQLPPGHIGFTAGFCEKRTIRLAHTASHADLELVFEFSHEPLECFDTGHG